MSLHLSARSARALGLTTFSAECQRAGLPAPVAEYRFHATRRWRFDWCFVAEKVGLEIDGGAWTQGRHTRGVGYRNDLEKIAEAMCLGFIVLRVMPEHIEDGRAIDWLTRILAWREAQR